MIGLVDPLNPIARRKLLSPCNSGRKIALRYGDTVGVGYGWNHPKFKKEKKHNLPDYNAAALHW